MKYVKKPVVIDAIQFFDDSERLLEIQEFMNNKNVIVNYNDRNNPKIRIETLEGTMEGNIGDYIIKGIKGEFYPCKPDIFAASYSKIEYVNYN